MVLEENNGCGSVDLLLENSLYLILCLSYDNDFRGGFIQAAQLDQISNHKYLGFKLTLLVLLVFEFFPPNFGEVFFFLNVDKKNAQLGFHLGNCCEEQPSQQDRPEN